jgi:hypothetical protein
MPIIRAPGAARRSPTAIADAAAKRQKQRDAKTRLPAMDAYLGINNPNSTQQRDQITLLTRAALDTVQGVIGST